jgi:hypothetical protein
VTNRLDLVHSDGDHDMEDVNTLREAYLSWARNERQSIDFGRINIRHGAAMGYNPTDWFKADAVRSVVSADPAVLRENRQGTVALQAQQVWRNGSIAAALSPKLDSGQDSDTFSLDAGRTNPGDRWLLAGTYRLSDGFSPQVLLHGGAGTPVQFGLNLSTLAGDAAVVFAEIGLGKGRPLVAQALGTGVEKPSQHRLAAGVTYTAPVNVTVTAEVEFNSAAPDRAQWDALGQAERLALLATADRLQDLPVRRALFLYATWKGLLAPRLDASAYVRIEGETHSRDQWLEARYRWDRADVAVQWHRFSGDAASVYGVIPRRQAVEVSIRYYF